MLYIKLEKNMKLVMTVAQPIYRGDNLNREIMYIIPKVVGKVDMLSAYVYLNYVRADGVADVVVLERMEEEYNDDYYQYTFPITCKLTKFPGEICTWIHIFTGSTGKPVVAKSGECMLRVQESKSMDSYLEDNYMTALYQVHRNLDKQMADMDEALLGKADGIEYVDGENALQLTSEGVPVGDPLNINETVEDVLSESDIYDVIEFDEDGFETEDNHADGVIVFGTPDPEPEIEGVIEFSSPDPDSTGDEIVDKDDDDGVILF